MKYILTIPLFLTLFAQGQGRLLMGKDTIHLSNRIDVLSSTKANISALSAYSTTAQANALYAPISHTHTFSSLTSKPTTLAGYGITDAFTQSAADALYSPLGHTHTFASLTSKPTTLGGYGITDAVNIATLSSYETVTHAASTYQPIGSYLTSESDPVWSAAASSYYTKTQADARYLQSFTESDPVYTAGIANYFNKTQADARYLQSFTETDPVWLAQKSGYLTTATAASTYATQAALASASAGTVTGGTITWPGTLYSTPTTGTVTSGTLNFSPALATQTANTVLAGPATGSPAAPTFRALTSADLGNNAILNQSASAQTATGWINGDFKAGRLISIDPTWTNSERYGVGATNGGTNSVAFGTNSTTTGTNAVAFGVAATASATSAAVGMGASASVAGNVAVGASANASGGRSIALGSSSAATGLGAIALGYGITSPANQITIGDVNIGYQILTMALGLTDGNNNTGISSTARWVNIRPTNGGGTNDVGLDLRLQGGAGTGNGLGGSLAFYTPAAGASGTTTQTQTLRETIDPNGYHLYYKNYTPTSSTDTTPPDNAMWSDGNYLYKKQSGTIMRIAWTTF